MAAVTEEQTKVIDVGELSRDFGLDITVSDGGLVTSALNQRQYRAECSKLYQQFMLTMADYIFEETQLTKRLQGLLLQKKQPRIGEGSSLATDDAGGAGGEEAETLGDEDAFTPAQMEEFRRLASSKASHRSLGKAGIVTHIGDGARAPTSLSINVPSGREGGGGTSDTPHLFPALKERPLTQRPSASRGGAARDLGSAATLHSKRHSVTAGAMMYGGRDEDCDIAMDPTSDFSTNRRMRMNPRAFSRLTSGSRIKVKVMDKDGEFVMKPVTGRPGVVSLHSGRDKADNSEPHPVRDSKDKMALVKTITSFTTPTLSSELKTNNLVAIQKSLLGQETRRMTVGDVMAKSRDRRARLFRVQMSTGRLDDWHVPGETRARLPSRIVSAGGRRTGRRGSSRLSAGQEKGAVTDPSAPREAASPSDKMSDSKAVSRARTAPASRLQVRTPAGGNASPRTTPAGGNVASPRTTPAGGNASPRTSPAGGNVASPRTTPAAGGKSDQEPPPTEGTALFSRSAGSRKVAHHPKLSVVRIDFQNSANAGTPPGVSGASTPALQAAGKPGAGSHQVTSPGRAVFPISANLSANKKSDLTGLEAEKRRQDALEMAEQECSVQMSHINTLRESAAVVRRWKEQDRDREQKLNKWRMRMSFAATRRGNLGKVLSKA